uniref:Zinc finger protein 112 n=1 Tax=Cacopsylla melanoneura TaxID=428564 RepID=A0A8D8YUP8_9HEMI
MSTQIIFPTSTLETDPTNGTHGTHNTTCPNIEQSISNNPSLNTPRSEIKQKSIAKNCTETQNEPSNANDSTKHHQEVKQISSDILETIDLSKTTQLVECTRTNYNDSSGETDEKVTTKKKPSTKINVTNIESEKKFIGNQHEGEMEETDYGEPVEIPCDVIIKEESEDPLRDPLDVDNSTDSVDKADQDTNQVCTPNELESIENTQTSTPDSIDTKPDTRRAKPPPRKRKPRKRMSRKKPQGQNIPPGISKYAGLIANTKLETCNRYQCHQCASSFSTIYTLNAHLLRHDGKTYACEFCGKTFGARATLNHHLQVHEGFKYTCDRCPAEFTLKHSWKRHMLIHAGVRYPCFVCEKSFSRKTDLNAHLDIHKGFKGSCHECKKTFGNKKSLREHLLIHRGIRYPCDYCDKSYSEKKTIRKHYRIKHNIEY